MAMPTARLEADNAGTRRVQAWFASPRLRSQWLVAAVGLVLLWVWWVGNAWYAQQLTANRRADVDVELSTRSAALQTAIGARFALLDSMVALVQSQPSAAAMDAAFEPFTTSLLASSSSSGIRNFALFPGGEQRYEYPTSGNAVPDAFRNLYTSPIAENRESVLRTLTTRGVALGQPRELAQGGLGLVATRAVFVEDRLWGFVTMALDVPPILSEAGMVAGDNQAQLRMALADGAGDVFFGSPQLATSDSESMLVPLPEGAWRLYAAPSDGWIAAAMSELRLVQVSSLIAVLLLTLVAWLTFSRHERLVFETRRLERLESAERAALAEAQQSRLAEQTARAQAEEALIARDSFLRTLAHDLKAPLTSLAWRIQVLRRTTREQVDPTELQRELGTLADQTAEAMAAIDELHDLTRAAAGVPLQLQRETLDLAEQVRQVVESLPPTSPAEVRCDGVHAGVWVSADRARLGRVLRNLLGNAARYSPLGGVVVVWVGATRDDDGLEWAEVRVQDHGIGIPAVDLPHVFERYRRGSNVEHIAGEGLGLASVRNLVEVHGGRVFVESEEGVGSTFTVRLPRLPTPHAMVAARDRLLETPGNDPGE
jgi:signal transduction histidine kinase